MSVHCFYNTKGCPNASTSQRTAKPPLWVTAPLQRRAADENGLNHVERLLLPQRQHRPGTARVLENLAGDALRPRPMALENKQNKDHEHTD